MSTINFRPNSFIDTLIAANVNDDEVIAIIKKQVTETLTNKLGENALNGIAQDYQTYKQKITPNLKDKHFLENVETNLSEFDSPDLSVEARHKVSEKLLDIASKRKAKETNIFKKFLDILSQAAQGHGFQTKSQWETSLVHKLQTINLNLVKSELKTIVLSAPDKNFNEKIAKLGKELNHLSDTDFKQILHDSLFQVDSGQNEYKKLLYNHLDQPKRNIFIEELASQDNWYEQAVIISEDLPLKEIEQLISEKMISKFESDLSTLKIERSVTSLKFLDILIEKTIKSHLDKNEVDKIRSLLDDPTVKAREILQIPHILKAEDVEKIKKFYRVKTSE